MALPNIMLTGRSGMVAAKGQMATTSHNIANANTEGFSRQRTNQSTGISVPHGSKNLIGSGTQLARTERINDSYVEKQVRNANKELAHMEEKDLTLKQTEDVFNEMGGEGLNRLVARFFNDFRKLANEPDSEAIRQSVRESTQAMINDFHRLRTQIEDVRKHTDSRIEGFVSEANMLTKEVKDLTQKIKVLEISGASANDLKDHRDLALKKLSSYFDVSMHPDKDGGYNVDLTGVGPLISGPNAESLAVYRSPKDDQGKPEGALSITFTGSANGDVTHAMKGGKIGALLEVRDKTLSSILERVDELAATVVDSVNAIHTEGYNRYGVKGVLFFKPITIQDRAASNIQLSDEIGSDINQIATAGIPDSPGDNRIAVAISQIQNMKIMGNGNSSMDDYYNSIVSDVGVAANRNRAAMTQQKDISLQLNKIRDQISGVSIDEETTNLLQYQRAFEASAKVIQVADEALKTVLSLRG